jgi:PAS domain S-box-containing protein
MTEKAMARIFQRVGQLMNDVVIVTDVNGKIVYVNDAFLEFSGYERQEVIGKNPGCFKSHRFDAEYYEELWSTITSGEEWNGEFLNMNKDGEEYWVFSRIAPVVLDNGTTYYVAVQQLITGSKALEEKLVEQYAKVESL